MKIGLVVAIETDSVFAHYTDYEKLESPRGFEAYKIIKDKNEIYIIRTGMGIAAAAAGTQYVITKYGVEAIVNFGVVGGLTAGMKKHKICVIDKVVHYRYDCSEFLDLPVGQVEGEPSLYIETDREFFMKAQTVCDGLDAAVCCSGDKFVATPEEKEYIHKTFGGDVCDMESAGILMTAKANGVPCLLLKAVSDGLADGAKGFFDELISAGNICLQTADKIMASL